jgi:hypothetical protein
VQNALVEQSVLHELDQVAELLPGKSDRPAEQRIDAGLEDPLDRAFKEVAGQQFPPMAPMSYMTMMSEQSAGDLTSIWL